MSTTLDEALDSLDGLEDLDAVGTLEQAGEIQRHVNLAQSELLKIACHWADLNATLDGPRDRTIPGTERLVSLGGQGTPAVAEFAPAELGAQLAMSPGGCAMVIADALDLRHRLPLLWRLVCDGDVKSYIARQVAQRTRKLDPGAAAQVDTKLARYAPTLPWGRLEPILDAAILAADQEQAKAETEAARDRQGVWIGRDVDHGYKKVFIRAAGPDVEAFDTAIDDIARALEQLGDPDNLDLRRAKAVGVIASTQATLELFTQAAHLNDDDAVQQKTALGSTALGSTAPGSTALGTTDSPRCSRQGKAPVGSATVYVHLSSEAVAGGYGVARVEGLGPVLRDQLGELLGGRAITVKPVIDLNDYRSVDGYEVPDWLDEAVHLRSPAECFPHSANTRRGGDADHTRPYELPGDDGPPGQTTLTNLGKLFRFQHRIKTHGRWKVIQLTSGVWLWHSPRGFSYLVDGAGTLNLGRG